MDFKEFMRLITRMKTAPAFDDVTMSSFENNLFGDEKHDCAHFTQFSYDRSTCNSPFMADEKLISAMNPLSCLSDSGNAAKHWRIRQGINDRDVGFATPAILALRLQNLGCDVDFELAWNEKHDGDYDIPEMFRWIDTVCRSSGNA